jgi:2,3,4,5-tetrahydropyridine-2,6-dicarboxylate N-succinyltransferase
MTLQARIDDLFSRDAADCGAEGEQVFAELKAGLNDGSIRAAEPDPASPVGWKVNAWVKKGILLGFRLGRVTPMSGDGFEFYDKHTLPLKRLSASSGARIVPGGSSIRDGCYIGSQVTCMPPMYINIGAYVGDGTLVDSHALVGSCAQIGRRCHLSAAAQIGGVLEPVGAFPIIIEDEVLVGGNCGIYEGTVVGARAVVAAGCVLTGSTPVYDLVRGKVYRRDGDHPLKIPPDAVVVPGSRSILRGRGRKWRLSLSTPLIVKYRDEQTGAAVKLEEWLR